MNTLSTGDELFSVPDQSVLHEFARKRVGPEVKTWLTAVDTIQDEVPGFDVTVAQACQDIRAALQSGQLLFVVSPLTNMDAIVRVRTPSIATHTTAGDIKHTAVVLDVRADCTSYNLVSGGSGLFTILLKALHDHKDHLYTADMLNTKPLGDSSIGRFPITFS